LIDAPDGWIKTIVLIYAWQMSRLDTNRLHGQRALQRHVRWPARRLLAFL
jgi:hypothetical protein